MVRTSVARVLGGCVLKARAWAVLLAGLVLMLPATAWAQEAVVLQLKWHHAFQFAGYYAALEKGYYREAGLEVDIQAGAPGIDVVERVVSGEADFGIGTSSLLLARAAGKPVVTLAVIFQHSPLAIAVPVRGALQSVHDLVGKRVMIEPQSDELFAYLLRERIATDMITLVPHSFDIDDLIQGRVDAASVYVTNEPYFLDKAGLSYQILTPRSAGIDFYGDNLFVGEALLRQHPERVAAFRAASLRGWEYALKHPDEIIQLIRSRYLPDVEARFLEFEAARMVSLIRADLIEIGYMHRGRWTHIAETYAALGLLPADFPLEGFLYHPVPDAGQLLRFAPYILGGLAAALLAGTLLLYILRVNRRLSASMRQLGAAAEELAISEERYRLLAEHASEVIWTMDLDGRFTYISPSVEKLRGFTVAEVMQQSLDQSLTPDSAVVAARGLAAAINAVRNGEPVPPFREDLEQPCKDGTTVWTEVTVTSMTNARGEFAGLLGVTRDVTKRRQTEERIRHMAQYDALTELPNRALFSETLKQALALARRSGGKLAVMFLDLDHFKPINDQFGHDVGDLVLRAAAGRIRGCLRESDTVARIGGDEFVLLLTNVEDVGAAWRVGEKIRHALEQPFPINGRAFVLSASLGVALYPEHGVSELELAKAADVAMYVAKREGRNGCTVYDPAWRDDPVEPPLERDLL